MSYITGRIIQIAGKPPIELPNYFAVSPETKCLAGAMGHANRDAAYAHRATFLAV